MTILLDRQGMFFLKVKLGIKMNADQVHIEEIFWKILQTYIYFKFFINVFIFSNCVVKVVWNKKKSNFDLITWLEFNVVF